MQKKNNRTDLKVEIWIPTFLKAKKIAFTNSYGLQKVFVKPKIRKTENASEY